MPFLLTLLAGLFLANGITAQTNLQLHWQTSLGAYAPQGVYRLAVCPSGISYFTDSQGRLTVLSPQGTVVLDQSSVPELTDTLALSCNPKNTAFRQSLSDISTLRLTPHQLTFDPAGNAYLLVLSPVAKILKFNSKHALVAERQISTSNNSTTPELLSRSLLIYTPTGHLALFTRHSRQPTFFNSDLSPTSPLNLEPNGLEVLGAGALPNGDLFVQTIEPNQLPKPKSRFMLTRINPTSPAAAQPEPLPPGVKGILQGADAQGKLYFLSVSPRTGAIIYCYSLLETP